MDNPTNRKRTSRIKVKTGCITCRIRKIKCDEAKPFCRKCTDTGRTCDGYESPFRMVTAQNTPGSVRPANQLVQRTGAFQPLRSALAEITAQDILLLSRCFSTKTMFDVKLGCDEEARQILLASLTDPPIRHAVSSLRALRDHLETSSGGDVTLASVVKLTPTGGYNYGLQQYCMALGGAASSLSLPGASGLKSALLCCQIFISIEQVQGNYAAMAQHMVRGLNVMHEHGARPRFVEGKQLAVPVCHGQIPLLDVFIIKLFAAPCKFSEPGAVPIVCIKSPHQQAVDSFRHLRAIAPDMRTKLTRIAALALEFLDKVSCLRSTADAQRLLSEKASLIESLELWLVELEERISEGPSGAELISVAFLRLFRQVMKVILMGALDSSPDLDVQLRIENDQFQSAATSLDARVKAYR